MFRLILLLTILINTGICCSVVNADDRTYATLRYSPPAGNPECPSQEDMETAVAIRLGYSPWRSGAPLHIQVTIRETENALVSKITVTTANGTIAGERSLQSDSKDCKELSESTELAVGIMIDPLNMSMAAGPSDSPDKAPSAQTAAPNDAVLDDAASTPAATLRPAEAPGDNPTAAPPTKPVAPESRSVERSGHPVIALGGHAAWRALPKWAGGVDALAWIQHRHFSVGGGVQFLFPVTDTFTQGQIKSSEFTGQLLACGHVHSLAVCGLASLGMLFAQSHQLENPQKKHLPVWRGGIRMQYAIRITKKIRILPFIDLSAAILRHELIDSTKENLFWKTPVVSISLGLLTGIHFF